MRKNHILGWVVFLAIIIGLNVASEVYGWGYRFY